MPLLVVELPDPHDLPAQRQNLLDILVTSLCPVVHWGDIFVDTTRFGKARKRDAHDGKMLCNSFDKAL